MAIDHAFFKGLWLIGAFLAGQMFLILLAARLFKSKTDIGQNLKNDR
jgi:hypothetical protein